MRCWRAGVGSVRLCSCGCGGSRRLLVLLSVEVSSARESTGQLFGFYDITQVSWMCERDGIFYMSADSCHGQMILRGARRLYICSVSRTSPCRYLAQHIISSTSSPPLSHRRVRRSFSPGVDFFRFRAVWILSTRMHGDVTMLSQDGYLVRACLGSHCGGNGMQRQVGTPARSGAGRAVSGIESR